MPEWNKNWAFDCINLVLEEPTMHSNTEEKLDRILHRLMHVEDKLDTVLQKLDELTELHNKVVGIKVAPSTPVVRPDAPST